MLPSQGDPEESPQQLYERLVTNDPTAPSDLAVRYLDRLSDWLISHNSQVPKDICETAAEDAILALVKNPGTYNPSKQSLEVYLRMSAQGDLKNLLRAERRHSDRRADWDAVEHSLVVGKYIQDRENDPALLFERESELREGHELPEAVTEGLTAAEVNVLELMRQAERKTAAYAVALGIQDRPLDEQRRDVKRVKDKLKKRLERAGKPNG